MPSMTNDRPCITSRRSSAPSERTIRTLPIVTLKYLISSSNCCNGLSNLGPTNLRRNYVILMSGWSLSSLRTCYRPLSHISSTTIFTVPTLSQIAYCAHLDALDRLLHQSDHTLKLQRPTLVYLTFPGLE